MDDLDPYPNLLGIDYAFNNNAIINLKQQHISFETYILCIIVPLDPNEGCRYKEPVNEDAHSSII
jgi:hypothetical protein